jgi:hypothetical protein
MVGSNVGRLASEWRGRLERYRLSPRTIVEFCIVEGVSVSSFYYWRKKLNHASASEMIPSIRRTDFAPVQLVASASANVIVQLPGGTRFEIPMSDSEAFERAITVFVSADSQRAEVSSC